MRLLPQIRLESEMGLISVSMTQGKHTMHHVQAQLEIEQPNPEHEIERTPPKLTIDQTQAREELNWMHAFRSIEENVNFSKQEVLKGIGRRAEEGGELMRIEEKRNPISEIAKRNIGKPLNGVNITFIPSHNSVKMSYEKAKLDYEWKVSQPRFEAKYQHPVIEYEPSEVIIEQETHPSLKIDFVNLFVDEMA